MNRINIPSATSNHLAAVLMGLLLILVSCHREELPDSNITSESGYPIEFSGMEGRLDSKADGDLPSDFTGFHVWAQNGSNSSVFGVNGTAVNTSDEGTTWTYSPVRYWQAGTYNFYAVAPQGIATGSLANGALALTFGSEGLSLSSQTDLMLATASNVTGRFNTDEKPEAVDLEFNHMMSKVSFSARNADANNTAITVTSVSISGNHKTASGYSTAGNGSWSWKSDDTAVSQTLAVANSNGVILSTIAQTAITPSDGVLVFPEDCNLSVIVTFSQEKGDLTASTTKTATIPCSWQPGYKYVYKLTVTADAIKIDSEPAVTPWGTGGSADSTTGSTDDPIEF
jgi:hypothetical protein